MPQESWANSQKIEYIPPYKTFFAPEQITSPEVAAEKLLFAPRKSDILKILEVAQATRKSEDEEVWILDVGGGNGFLAKLLLDAGKEHGINLHVVVVDPNEELLQKANRYYKTGGEKKLHFIVSRAAESPKLFKNDFNLVINSWMPQDTNLGVDIRKIKTSARIYIRDTRGATGTADTYKVGKDFIDFVGWPVLHGIDLYRRRPETDQNPSFLSTFLEIQLSKKVASEKFKQGLRSSLRAIDNQQTHETKTPQNFDDLLADIIDEMNPLVIPKTYAWEKDLGAGL